MSGARHIEHHKAPTGTAAHLRDKFHVILVIMNSRRWRTRYEMGNDAIDHWRAMGTEPWVIECAFGARAFAMTDPKNPRHIRVRTAHEYWNKEALINLAVQRLPRDWQFVAWVDADVMFARPDIINETIQQLQHHRIVQMFSECHDMGPDYQLITKHEGFAWCYQQDFPKPKSVNEGGSYYYETCPTKPGHHFWHSGFAWACRRSAWNALGGLIDWAILGSADHHMAWALVGDVMRSVHGKCHPVFRAKMEEWQRRAEKHIRHDVGCVPGTILHGWHGRKFLRHYADRWQILVETQYDPDKHLKLDWQGLPQLVDRGDPASLRLRDGIRDYSSARNEDSTDL